MKHFYILLLAIFFSAQIQAQNAPFLTTWNVTSGNRDIMIPTIGSGYNYTIDFGDGTIQNNVTGDAFYTYSTPGIYTVSISGDFPRIYFQSAPESIRRKISSIDQWGDIVWQSMNYAFARCPNMVINATDSPNLSLVTDMSYMFSGSDTFNQSINHWDVSNVTNMSYMFVFADSFNQSLNNWDVSNVTNMANMFHYALDFNGTIDNWDVSNVTNMSEMFYYAISFNQSLNNWNVSNVTDMSSMFRNATFFNQPLNNWDVSNINNMAGMFRVATSFNQPLNNWDVSNVSVFCSFSSGGNYIGGMFQGATSFNQSIDNWNLSSATALDYMFAGASSFNQAIDNWNVSQIASMIGVFKDATAFNQSLNNWDVSKVEDMTGMFSGASLFNGTISNWNVSNVETMHHTFESATSFNQNINSWDVSNVESMWGMFQGASSFDQPINDWNVSNVKYMERMFREATSFNQPINNWRTTSLTHMDYMFFDAISFNQPVYSLDTSNLGQFVGIFRGASSFNQDLSRWEYDVNYNPGQHKNLSSFVSSSGLDVNNYDALLNRFLQAGVYAGGLGATDLIYCDDTTRDILINTMGWIINGDIFSPDCNNINGFIIYDSNNDGCDTNDVYISNFMVSATDATTISSTFSDNGIYNMNVLGPSFTVSIPNAPSYFTVSPASANVTFSGSNTEVLDFCVTANQSINDLNITLLPPSEARPGFEADYRLVIRNVGTETIANVDATLQFDDLMQQFINSTPAPGTTTANMLTFPIGTLQPFQKFETDITLLTFQPPTVNGGDILNFTANVTPAANDFTPNDNTYDLAQVVVNSYDPNDKQVLQGEELHIDKTDEYLDYLIRFQNTGTASAINVRILDTLHPKLDWNTLVPISASHDYYVKIKDGNHVEFMFDDIHLPDSISNEPASHGFVAYKIKPKSDVQVGDVISGDAAIYFDFNAPIITNMVSTTVIESLGISDFSGPLNQIVLYPNPTDKTLHIHLTEGLELLEVLIYDLQGREVQKIRGRETTLDVGSLSPGLYFLYITTDRGVVNRKMVKK